MTSVESTSISFSIDVKIIPMEYSEGFKSGFVAVMGRPNVGKSTLINALIGTKIAAVSPWPQTTRKRQMGILTLDQAQIIFMDTPGIHNPLHKLGEMMNLEAVQTLKECDLTLIVVDVSGHPSEEEHLLANHYSSSRHNTPTILVLNKVDLADEIKIASHRPEFEALFSAAETLPISATRGDNLDLLLSRIIHYLPENPPFFPEDQLTDAYERDLVADLIREAALVNLRAEVPHSIAVRIDEYKERSDEMTYIAATLFVERDSQKGIVIGQGAAMLKKIGIAARQEIEAMTGRKVFLQLRVKVRKNWRNDEAALRLFGFKHPVK